MNRELSSAELIERILVYQNSRFRVFKDLIATGHGEIVHNYLTIQPKIRTERSAAGICISDFSNHKFWLMRS